MPVASSSAAMLARLISETYLSVVAVDPKRYYSVMLCDGNTYNYGYIGTKRS